LSDAHNIVILVSLESDDGSGPLKPALSMYNCVSLARFPNSEGSEPLKLFELMLSDTRFVRFPSSFGTGPDNELMPKLMYCIAVNSPINDGKGPVK
jgi:hypothetical protein